MLNVDIVIVEISSSSRLEKPFLKGRSHLFEVFKIGYVIEPDRLTSVLPFQMLQTAFKTSLLIVRNLALKVAFSSFFAEMLR